MAEPLDEPLGVVAGDELGDEPLRVGEAVIVEVERGRDLGRITAIGRASCRERV